MTAIADQRILPPRFTPLRFEALKAQAEANVDARRRKLAAKLHAEELALQNELVANQVTPEERRAALERRAVDLVRRREEERVAFAEQMLYRQWRDGCDGVRQGDSHAQLRAALEGRSSQLEEKAAARETAAREHAAFEVMYEAERLKKEERHAREIADIKKKADEAVRVLDQQVAENRKLRAEKAEAAKREVEEMKSQWAAEEARHDADIAAKLAKNMRIGEDLKAFKATRQAELAAIKEREEAIDRELLEEAMRQKAEEEAREAELKERKKEQDAIYRTHLAALLQKDGEDESERDRLVAEQQALYEAKRQAEKDRAEAARAKLMAEVHAELRAVALRWLRELSFVAEAGTTTAIVGPTGAGMAMRLSFPSKRFFMGVSLSDTISRCRSWRSSQSYWRCCSLTIVWAIFLRRVSSSLGGVSSKDRRQGSNTEAFSVSARTRRVSTLTSFSMRSRAHLLRENQPFAHFLHSSQKSVRFRQTRHCSSAAWSSARASSR